MCRLNGTQMYRVGAGVCEPRISCTTANYVILCLFSTFACAHTRAVLKESTDEVYLIARTKAKAHGIVHAAKHQFHTLRQLFAGICRVWCILYNRSRRV